MISEEMIAYGLGGCFCNAFWALLYVFLKYSILSFGYPKKAKRKRIEKVHKSASAWRKLFLVELTSNATEHLLTVGACFLYNAITIIFGPIAIVVCYILACIHDFSTYYATLIFAVPLCWSMLCGLLFSVPAILFIPEVRRQYFK